MDHNHSHLAFLEDVSRLLFPSYAFVNICFIKLSPHLAPTNQLLVLNRATPPFSVHFLYGIQLSTAFSLFLTRPRFSIAAFLASWFRLKYPHIVHGAIAASAPVLALEGLRHPTPDPEAFARTVTNAAGPAGGAAESCADNVRHAFAAVLGSSAPSAQDDSTVASNGGGKLRGAGANVGGSAADAARRLRVCPGQEPQGDDALEALAWWAKAAFDYLAMGNFPYATGYILNSGDDGVELPPWPLRKACSYLADPSLQVRCYRRLGAKEHPSHR